MHTETVYKDLGIAYMYTVHIRVEEGGMKGLGKAGIKEDPRSTPVTAEVRAPDGKTRKSVNEHKPGVD